MTVGAPAALPAAFAAAVLAAAALPAGALAGTWAALDALAGLRDPATGGLDPGPGVGARGRAALDAWATLAVAGAGEDPALWRAGGRSLAEAPGPRPGRRRPSALGRWTVARAAVGGLAPRDRRAAAADLAAAVALVPDAARTSPRVTAWALLGLRALGADRAAQARAAAALRALQRPGGGWPGDPGRPADTAATSLAIQALATRRDPADAQALLAARTWLLGVQHPDGGFPTVPGGPSTGLDTAWGALAVWALGESPRRGPWARGGGPLRLLLRRQRPDGGIADSARGRSVPLVTATALLALRARPLPLAPAVLAPPPDRAPRILRRAPAPGTAPGAIVAVLYADDSGGTGVDPAGVRLRSGTRDVTARARVTAFSLQIPADALGALPTRLTIVLPDRAGNVRVASWTVGGVARGV